MENVLLHSAHSYIYMNKASFIDLSSMEAFVDIPEISKTIFPS